MHDHHAVHRSTRAVVTGAVALLTLGLWGGPAGAGARGPESGAPPDLEWVANCWSEHHGGPPYENPNGDPIVDVFSAVDGAGTVDGAPPGAPWEMVVVGPGGFNETVEGTLDDQRRFEWAAGINQGGTYSSQDLVIDLNGQRVPVEIGPDVTTTYDVQPPREVDCSASDLPPGEPPPQATTSSTPEAEEEEAEDDEAEDEEGDATDDGGFPWIFVTVAGIGSFVLGGLLWFLARRGQPCAEKLRAWLAAQDECDQARARQQRAEQEHRDAMDERGDAEEDLENLCDAYPPACRKDSWIEDSQSGRRVTSSDLWVNRQWAKEAWDRYADAPSEERARQTEQAWKDGPPADWAAKKRQELDEARQQHDQLEQRADKARQDEEAAEAAADKARQAADEACADADAKRRAYEECMGQQAAKAKGEGSPPSPGEPGAPTGPGGPGGPAVVARPEEGAPCEEGETRVEELSRFGPRWVIADFSVTAEPQYRKAADAREMSINLGDLANQVDGVFDAIGYTKAAQMAAGKAFGRAAVEAGATAAEIPTNLTDVVGKVLEYTADFGSKLSAMLAVLLEDNELYLVRSPAFAWIVEARWLRVWRCVDGRWQCSVELAFSKGRLQKLRLGPNYSPEDLDADKVAGEVRRRATRLSQRIQRDYEAVQEFLDQHQPGPCK